MSWLNYKKEIKNLKTKNNMKTIYKLIDDLYSDYRFGVYDTENYTNIETLAKNLHASGNIEGLNAMLTSTSGYENIDRDLDFIKFLIGLGANAFTETAADTQQFDTIEYLIDNHGVNDFALLAKNDLMWDDSYHIYLIEKGLDPEFFDEDRNKDLLLNNGGIILNRDPRRLIYKEARPYINRHAGIKKILQATCLIPHVINVVMGYVLYQPSSFNEDKNENYDKISIYKNSKNKEENYTTVEFETGIYYVDAKKFVSLYGYPDFSVEDIDNIDRYINLKKILNATCISSHPIKIIMSYDGCNYAHLNDVEVVYEDDGKIVYNDDGKVAYEDDVVYAGNNSDENDIVYEDD